jgi:hypothetical protein
LTDIDITPGLIWPDLFGNGLGNAVRGWRADDFAMSGLVDAPIILVVDSRGVVNPDACPIDPDPDVPGNPNACGVVTANAGPDQLIPVSGSSVVLDAAASFADECVNGHLEYQWDIGGTIIQAFSTKSSLIDAPQFTTAYNVLVRCSTDNDCAGSDTALVVPGDQLEASGVPGNQMDLDLPSGNNVRMVAHEPIVGGPCDLWIMGVQVSGGGGLDLREQIMDDGSSTELAKIVRDNTCTDGAMSQIGVGTTHEFIASDAVAVGDVEGYMSNALCTGVVGSLGRVKEGADGGQASRGRLNPNSVAACP